MYVQAHHTATVSFPESSSGRVSDLHRNGYSHQLAWLEAYFTDEARDRAVDGGLLDGCVHQFGPFVVCMMKPGLEEVGHGSIHN